jgi:hypothetical protein
MSGLFIDSFVVLTANVADCRWSHGCATLKDPDIIISAQHHCGTF